MNILKYIIFIVLVLRENIHCVAVTSNKWQITDVMTAKQCIIKWKGLNGIKILSRELKRKTGEI